MGSLLTWFKTVLKRFQKDDKEDKSKFSIPSIAQIKSKFLKKKKATKKKNEKQSHTGKIRFIDGTQLDEIIIQKGSIIGRKIRTFSNATTALKKASKKPGIVIWGNPCEIRVIQLASNNASDLVASEALKNAWEEKPMGAVLFHSDNITRGCFPELENKVKWSKLIRRSRATFVPAAACVGPEAGIWVRVGRTVTECALVNSEGKIEKWMVVPSISLPEESILATSAATTLSRGSGTNLLGLLIRRNIESGQYIIEAEAHAAAIEEWCSLLRARLEQTLRIWGNLVHTERHSCWLTGPAYALDPLKSMLREITGISCQYPSVQIDVRKIKEDGNYATVARVFDAPHFLDQARLLRAAILNRWKKRVAVVTVAALFMAITGIWGWYNGTGVTNEELVVRQRTERLQVSIQQLNKELPIGLEQNAYIDLTLLQGALGCVATAEDDVSQQVSTTIFPESAIAPLWLPEDSETPDLINKIKTALASGTEEGASTAAQLIAASINVPPSSRAIKLINEYAPGAISGLADEETICVVRSPDTLWMLRNEPFLGLIAADEMFKTETGWLLPIDGLTSEKGALSQSIGIVNYSPNYTFSGLIVKPYSYDPEELLSGSPKPDNYYDILSGVLTESIKPVYNGWNGFVVLPNIEESTQRSVSLLHKCLPTSSLINDEDASGTEACGTEGSANITIMIPSEEEDETLQNNAVTKKTTVSNLEVIAGENNFNNPREELEFDKSPEEIRTEIAEEVSAATS